MNWIKRSQGKKGLTVKTLNESDFMKHLELAIQFGKSFLFESVGEELDPMLDPILEKAVVIEGGSKTIQLGDKKVFRFFFFFFFTIKDVGIDVPRVFGVG